MEERNLLIAGCGYLGSEIAFRAEKNNWKVTKLSYSGNNQTIQCDISKKEDLKKWATNDSISLIHCASSRRGGIEKYESIFIRGCENLVRYFPNAHFLFTSSTSVYRQTDGSTVNENSSTENGTEYSKILLEAEKIILQADGVIVRLSGIYGPKRSAILSNFLTGKGKIEGKGERNLNQIHKEDAAEAILYLLSLNKEIKGEVFNVSDGNPISQISCYQKLSQIFSLPLPQFGEISEHKKRPWTNKKISNQKLKKLGWRAKYSDFLKISTEIAKTL